MDDQLSLAHLVAVASERQSLLDGADWGAMIWALVWATIVSTAKVMRDRRDAEHSGEKPRELRVLMWDIVLGSVVGFLAPLLLQLLRPQWATLSGVTIAAAVGGYIGARAFDWAQQAAQARAEQAGARSRPPSGGSDAP